MDLLEATSAELKRKVGDVECTFKQLTAYDRAELLRADLLERQAAWKAQRAELVANLKESGIDGEQMFAELETFRERCPYRATELDSIFAASLHDAHGAHAEELARKARITLNDKAQICGLSVETKKDDLDPNPMAPTPTAYGTTGPT
jgi:hypothetical protein